jgi:hypothetical protein
MTTERVAAAKAAPQAAPVPVGIALALRVVDRVRKGAASKANDRKAAAFLIDGPRAVRIARPRAIP